MTSCRFFKVLPFDLSLRFSCQLILFVFFFFFLDEWFHQDDDVARERDNGEIKSRYQCEKKRFGNTRRVGKPFRPTVWPFRKELVSFSCALRRWRRGNIASMTALPVLDCLNLVQHMQPSCMEGRFLPQQNKKNTAKAQSFQHIVPTFQQSSDNLASDISWHRRSMERSQLRAVLASSSSSRKRSIGVPERLCATSSS